MIVIVDRRRPAKENVRQSHSPYSSCTGTPGTVQQLYGDTDDRKNRTRPVEADSIVVKTLCTVLGSFHDGVPLKLKRKMADQAVLNYLSIGTYHFRPLLAADGQYL